MILFLTFVVVVTLAVGFAIGTLYGIRIAERPAPKWLVQPLVDAERERRAREQREGGSR